MFKFLYRIESALVEKFSCLCQSPHWFFFWFLYFFAWTLFRQLIHPSWYTSDTDFLFIAWSSAILPFWVENSVKVSQSTQLAKQDEQLRMLHEGSKLLITLTNLNLEIGKKILATVDDIQDDLETLDDSELSEDEVEDYGSGSPS